MLRDSPFSKKAVHGLCDISRMDCVVVRIADVIARFDETEEAEQGQRLDFEDAHQIVTRGTEQMNHEKRK